MQTATLPAPTLPAWATGPSLEPAPLDGSTPITDAMIADAFAWGDGINRFHIPAAAACHVLDRVRQTAAEGWVTDRHHAGTEDLADREVWQAARWTGGSIVTHDWGTWAQPARFWTIRRRVWIPPMQAPGDFAAGLPGVLMIPLGYDWRGWDGDPAAMLELLRGVVWDLVIGEIGR